LIAVLVMLGVVPSAAAQGVTWTDRVIFGLDFGLQPISRSLSLEQTFTVYAEPGSLEFSRDAKGSPFAGAMVGMPLRSPYGVGLIYGLRDKKSDGTINASVPDPIVFDQPRQVTGTAAGLRHRETWVAPTLIYFWPAGEKLDVFIMGGPAFVFAEHEFMSGSTITEGISKPVVEVTTATVKQTVGGFLAGADIRYMLTARLGVGGFVRFGLAKMDVTESASLSLGGLQAGGGLRLRF
jgi:hypothetical protein